MKRRRRKKSETKFYMVMSIICLVVLFAGYSYVYKLSEARKTGQEITTISLNYDGEGAANKYNEFFDKVMSYFNIFFEETFKESDDSKIIENKEDEPVKEVYKIIDSADREQTEDLQVFDEKEYSSSQIAVTEVYLASNRKDDFFKVIESNTISRSSVPREMKIDTASINKNINFIIYHTHATESYLPNKESNYRTHDENYNVMGIGNIITSNLKNYGLNITHLKDYNDYPDYNKSYANSNYNVKQVLSNSKKNVMIDIHRDGADEGSSYEEFLSKVKSIEINGKTAATCTLVIGDKNGNLEDIKKMAQTTFDTANEMYPGLFRDIVIRNGAYFNQYLSDYAMLIEVGTTLNNIEEAQYTADLLSEILCETIAKINN
ncbi:stage II sporulation protein P [Sedimentibacter acidaminivorans]|jgi:stage II sporulation protein P|uniref:Stage II sporulation protein P n=1 Tax=Sedimentibacter acidaminivorans TaxID=913099 RepID=A0ABS4GHQ2_9FIRM|nr:stage II sporulation protein P [Sedimentibacter acidaminivorans]MBP1927072.1 stage II sporulation protein P [Sedimentibacter acidaminivorans]